MFGRILRQYRRFVFASFLFTVAFFLWLWLDLNEWPADLGSGWLFVATWAILLILVIGLPIIVVALLLPNYLVLVEILLISFVILAATDPLVTYAMASLDVSGWVYCVWLFGVIIAVGRVLYGPLMLRILKRDLPRRSRILRVDGTPETLWPKLCPTPGEMDRFYWPNAKRLPAPDGLDCDFVLSQPRRWGLKDDLNAVTVQAESYPNHMTYRTTPLAGTAVPSILYDIRIAGNADGTSDIHYAETYLDVPVGFQLLLYLNHGFNDSIASIRARLTDARDWSLQGAQMPRRSHCS